MSRDAPRQPLQRREYLLVATAALLLYGVSVAPGPLWQDSGLAQVRVLRHDLTGNLGLALAHPLYYAVAIAFEALPAGNPALRVSLVSVVFGAVTVANAYILLRWLTRRRTAAVVGTLSLALAHTFWQHGALAEVYTLSTALLTTELLCLAKIGRHLAGTRWPADADVWPSTGGNRRADRAEPGTPPSVGAPGALSADVHDGPRPAAAGGLSAWFVLLFAANGVGLSNHLLALLALPVWGILLLWMLLKRQVPRWTLLACGVAWLSGAALYLGVILNEIAGGAPAAETVRSALLGGSFGTNVLNLAFTPQLLAKSVLYLGLNFPTPTALLAFVGLAAAWKRVGRPLAACLTALLAIHLGWAARYDVADQYTFFIPAVVLIAVFIGLGADRVLATVRCRRTWARVLVLLALVPPAVYAPLPWIVRRAGLNLGLTREIPYRDAYRYFLWPWKTGDDGPLRFAEAVRALPAGSFVIADTTSARPLYYLMELGRWDTNVTVWPPPGHGHGLVLPSREDVAAPLAQGRLYVVSPAPRYCPDWILEGYALEDVGPAHRVRPRD